MIFALPVLVDTPAGVATYQAQSLRAETQKPLTKRGKTRTVVKR